MGNDTPDRKSVEPVYDIERNTCLTCDLLVANQVQIIAKLEQIRLLLEEIKHRIDDD